MNLFKKIKFILVSVIFTLVLIGCDLFNTTDSTKSKYSTININIPSSRDIIDDISSYQLTVTGSDFEDVVETFTENKLSIDILVGTERTFTLLIFGEDETIALFKGEKTIDLESGVDVDLELEANQSVRYISYDANIDDADTVPENIYYADGEDVTISVLGNTGALVNGDYALVGWNTEADGSGTTYFEDDEITLSDSDIILYAIWGFSYYELTVTETSLEEDSDDISLPFLTLYKNEVSFIIKNNSVYESYDDSEEVVTTTSYINEIYRGKDFTFTKSEGNRVITLNNVLVEKDDYDYDVDSGDSEEIYEDSVDTESNEAEEVEYDEMKVVITINDDAVSGDYHIDITYIDDDSEDEVVESITGTYKAYNKSNSAEILSVDIDGDGKVEDFSVTGEAFNVDFDGEIDETKVTPIITVSLGATISPASGEELDFSDDVTFTVTAEDGREENYTVFAKSEGRVTYDLNGGSGTLPTDDTNYMEGDLVALDSSSEITLENFTFIGWSLTSDGAVITSLTMPAEAVILYAAWEANLSSDLYEPDNSATEANSYGRYIGIGESQYHTTDTVGDYDWMMFTPNIGVTYTIYTYDSGDDKPSDTYLYLYDIDGESLLRSNDDGGDGLYSLIDYTFESTGPYYIKVGPYNANYINQGFFISIKIKS